MHSVHCSDDKMEPMPASAVSLSVVMPAHNEEGYLELAVGEVAAELSARVASGFLTEAQLIVVENGSTDRTRSIAQRLADEIPTVTLLSLDRANYGAALRAGLLHSTSDVVVNFDVDYYDFGFLDGAVSLITDDEDSYEVIVGSKRGEGAQDTRSWHRRLVTATFSTILRIGFGLNVSDTHGMKAMKRSSVLTLVNQCRQETDLFDTELVLRAERSGLRVTETPVRVEEKRPSRSPIAKRVIRTLWGLAKLRVVITRS